VIQLTKKASPEYDAPPMPQEALKQELETLAAAARQRGVRRFVATMLPDNLGAHRVFARVAQERRLTADGTVHELRGEVRPGRRRGARRRRSARALR
jgi:RimJ/RimL family protein N-acetyltransferase